jgi:hypothetical protein
MVLDGVQGISVLSYSYDLVNMFNVGSVFYLTTIGCYFLSARSLYVLCSGGDRRQLPEAVTSLCLASSQGFYNVRQQEMKSEYYAKGKGEGRPRTDHEGPEGEWR